jgi:microcystin-dependent protein
MTVSTTESRIGYNGNGATTAFAFPYRFLVDADLVVTLVRADTVQVVQTLNTDYTVTGAGNDAGGTVTMVVPPATGQRLVIVRDVPLTQETDYISGDPFPAEAHERALDKLTMISQRLNNLISRSIRFSDADLLVSSTILPSPIANATLMWNATGTALVNGVGSGEFVGLSPYMRVVLGAVDSAEALTNLGAAADAEVVKLTGAQTVAGVKTFSDRPIIPDGTAAQNPVSKAQLDAATPVGAVQFFATSTAPTGWLKANGAEVSRTTYAALDAVLGTTFGAYTNGSGGVGTTHFRLPDLRGEFVRGFDDGKGTDSGRAFGSSQAGQMPSHTHTQEISNSTSGGLNRGPGSTGAFLQYSGTTTAAGGTENSSENRPRNIALLACIKY